MSDLQTLLERISAETTAGFTKAVERLNEEANGTVYAVLGLLDSGIVGVRLVANTLEHLAEAPVKGTTPADHPYWEVHPAEFGIYIWEPFAAIHDLLDDFHDGYWDGDHDIGDVSPDDFLLPIIQKAYTDANVQSKVVTTYGGSLLLGLGYADVEESQVAHVLAASEALNTPEWHQKVLAVWPQ